jgi:hypothetical protein
MELDIGATWSGYEDFSNKIRTNPIVVDGFKFANLEVVEEWKKEMVKKYDRPKDNDYLQKIKTFRDKIFNKPNCIIIHGCPSNVEKAMDSEKEHMTSIGYLG